MRATGRRDTTVELRLRSALHRRGWRYRVDVRPAPDLRTRADLVFRSRRVAVYVDGCFWHGCPEHYRTPATRGSWWDEKIASNRRRDELAMNALIERGWAVVRIWEHVSLDEAVGLVETVLQHGPTGHDPRP
jgi:DNA mismatch endonuclease, patch repair protein